MYKKYNLFSILTLVILISLLGTSCQQGTPQPTITSISEIVQQVTEEIKPEVHTEVVKPTIEPTVLPTVEPTMEFIEEIGPRYGGTLIIPYVSDAQNCNPGTTSLINPFNGNVVESLAEFNAELELQPLLAESWEVSEDGLMITFHLRRGVKWHDGFPFTSADVKYTWDNMLVVHHPRGRISNAALESVETPDDYTVVFRFNASSPGFLFQIGVGESPIMPKHIYENEDVLAGPHATCAELPVGTGPFKVVDHTPGVSITFERNDNWWGTEEGTYWAEAGAPFLDKIVVVVVPDESARVNGFETGEFGFLPYTMMPPHEIPRFQAMEGREVTFECTGPPLMVMYQINMRREPFDDVRVRQALAWALDLDQINEIVFFGAGVPSSSFFPPAHPEYNPNITNYYPRDLAKAEALLDEAGYPRGANGVRFEMSVTSDTRSHHSDLAHVFKQQVEETGIKVNLDILERNIWVDQVYIQHNFDVNAWQAGVYEPGTGVARIMRSDNIGEAQFNNASAYVNPEVDQLWDIYNSTFDPEIRRDAIFRIQEIVNQDLPAIFVNTPTNWMSFNTEEFTGFPLDCNAMYNNLVPVWWNEGRPTP